MAKLQTMSATEFAELCGVVTTTVTNWINEGMPALRTGKATARHIQIDPYQAVPWVLLHREAPAGSHRERLAKAQAEKVEMENEARRGHMIADSQVEETILGLAAYLAREHDALPGRVANELASINEPAVIRAKLITELRIIRDGIAEYSARTADACEDLADEYEDQPSAAEPNGERVGGSDEDSAAG